MKFILIFTICLAWANTPPQTLLQSLGITLLDEKVSDFELPKLKGGEGKLSDYKGKWIWLAFWATWCGPCRYELPQLEKLNVQMKGKNFQVVGVSLDTESLKKVNKFARGLGIQFPLFHDQSSQVGGIYGASALPSIYVISPAWRLVGVLRGAKSWEGEHVENTIAELVKSDAKDWGITAGDTNKLPPPKLSLKIPTEVGKFEETLIKVLLDWPMSSQNYLIKTPKLTLPQDWKEKKVSSLSKGDGLLEYHFVVESGKAGKVVVGPVEMGFSPRQGGGELFAREDGREVLVKGTSKSYGFLFLLLLPLLLFFKKKKQVVKEDEPILVSWEALEKKKGENDYSLQLLKAYVQVGNSVEKERELINQLEYGGHNLSFEEISYYEKSLKRILSAEEI